MAQLKKVAFALFLVCICSILGCTKEKATEEITTLTVLYHNERQFFQAYGAAFITKYPNYSIQVVELDPLYKKGLSQQAYMELIDAEKPDILYNFNLRSLINEGKLINLEPYTRKSKILNVANMNPNIVSYLRLNGDGNLFALTPTFQGKGLFYNKQLFDKYGIKYPTDFMTWEELLTVAKKFPKEANDSGKALFGYYHRADHPYWIVREMAETNKVEYADMEGKTVTIHSNEWKRMFDAVVAAYRNGSIKMNDNSDPFHTDSVRTNPFSQGNAAMMVDYSYQVEYLKDIGFEWGVVTAPVHANFPNQGASISANSLFGIHASSANVEAAWKLIEYIASEEYAKSNAKSGISRGLSIYEKYEQTEGVLLDSFYKLAPQDAVNLSTPFSFNNQFNTMIEQEMTQVINGNKGLDEMLSELQHSAQQQLDHIWQEKSEGKR